MPHAPHLLASEPASPPRKRRGRRVASLLLAAGLTLTAITVFLATPASAAGGGELVRPAGPGDHLHPPAQPVSCPDQRDHRGVHSDRSTGTARLTDSRP